MNDNAIFDLTRILENLIDNHENELDIMRELLQIAVPTHAYNHCEHFRIGGHVYNLKKCSECKKIGSFCSTRNLQIYRCAPGERRISGLRAPLPPVSSQAPPATTVP